MMLKQAILTIMDRDTLKAVVDDLEIEGVDRRSVEEMRARVSRSRRAAPEVLLGASERKAGQGGVRADGRQPQRPSQGTSGKASGHNRNGCANAGEASVTPFCKDSQTE